MTKKDSWKNQYLIVDTRGFANTLDRPEDSNLFLVLPAGAESAIQDPELILLFIDLRKKLAWNPDPKKDPDYTHIYLRNHEKIHTTFSKLRGLCKIPNGPISVSYQDIPESTDPIDNPINLSVYPAFLRTLLHFCGDMDWK